VHRLLATTFTRLAALGLLGLAAQQAIPTTAQAADEKSPPPTSTQDVVIHAGVLIDGISQTPRRHVSILVHDGKIAAIQDGFTTPAGVPVLDLSDLTVLPGLIDCHVHLDGATVGLVNRVTLTPGDLALIAAFNAKRTLDAGFTTVRNVGADYGSDVAVKRAIEHGLTPGPRLWVAREPLSPTGGHSDPTNGMQPDVDDPQWRSRVVDGPEEGIRAVREHRKHGADLIKIMPSGGVGSIGDDPSKQLMSNDEIKAIIDTAHSLGMKVAAHAHGKLAIDNTVRLGVDSIEHGTYADKESYELMKQHGTYLVPTELVAQRLADMAKTHPERMATPDMAAKILPIAPIILHNLTAAYRAGVKIAFGTDTTGGIIQFGENAKEFAVMVAAGMKPMDAIIAATGNAADLLGAPEQVGSIRTGRFADIIAVSGDPLQDITRLERVSFVMKGGVVYKSNDKSELRADARH
jgi:imidazolonepropionase-like amidohydrolase